MPRPRALISSLHEVAQRPLELLAEGSDTSLSFRPGTHKTYIHINFLSRAETVGSTRLGFSLHKASIVVDCWPCRRSRGAHSLLPECSLVLAPQWETSSGLPFDHVLASSVSASRYPQRRQASRPLVHERLPSWAGTADFAVINICQIDDASATTLPL